MFRLVTYLLLIVFLLTIVRGVIGIIAKAVGDALRTSSRDPHTVPPGDERIPITGELKKDPVCGTYTAASTSLQRTVRGETFYFCSPECRDKFTARA